MKRHLAYILLTVLLYPVVIFGDGTWSVFPSPSARFIYDHGGYIWVGTNKHLYRYDLNREEWKTHYDFNYVYSMFQASNGTIWIGTRDGVTSIQGDTVYSYTIEDGLPYYIIGGEKKFNKYWRITEAPDSTIWVGSTGGISSFNGTSWNFIGRDQGYPFSRCSGIACDHDGGVWVTAFSYGVARFHNNDWATKDDLTLKKVYDPFVSPDGSLWITSDDGAICYKEGNWIEYSEKNGLLVDRVTGYYFPPDGDVWIGTNEGIFIFDGTSFSQFSEDLEARYRYAANFQNGKDSEIWMSTMRGIVIYNSDIQPITIQQPSETEYVERHATVTFTWDDYPEARSYEIEFSRDWDFMNHDTFSVDTNTFSQDINSSFSVSSPYYWRVRPLFQDSGGYWSNPRYIYTTKEIPDISFPYNNFYVESLDSITFMWRSVPDITNYELAISEDVNFSKFELYSVPKTTYILDLDKINTLMESHYWRVRAVYEENPGDWSEVRTFYTHVSEGWKKFAQDRMILIEAKYHEGYIWLCTEIGLYRYDTTINELEEVPLAPTMNPSALTSLAVGNDGTVWIGSTTGLYRYVDSGWEVMTQNNGLAGNNICAVDIDSSENIWCVSDKALNMYDGDSWVSYDLPTNTKVTAMKVTPAGDICIGSDGWVGIFSDGTWTKITGEIKNINDIECPPDGSVWIGSDCSSYLAEFTRGNIEFHDPNSRRLSLKPIINSLHKAGYDWVDEGFYVLQGDSTKYVRSVTVRDDGVVFNGIRYGICYFDGHDWILIPSKNIQIPAGYSADQYWKFENVSGIAVCGDIRTWGIFDNGVICELIDGHFEYRAMLPTLPTDYIKLVEFDENGTMWLGTINMGVLKYDGSEWINISQPDGLPYFDIQKMSTGSNDDIWVTTTSVGYHIRGYMSHIINDQVVENYDFEDTQFNCLAIHTNETIFGGTSDKGIITIKNGAVETITTDNGLLSNSIHDIEISPSGELWVATSAGLCRYVGNDWRHITDIDAVTSNSIIDINIDNKGYIWFVVSNNEVWCYDGNKWHDRSPASVSFYSNDIELLFDVNEDTWVTQTSAGVLHYSNGSWISDDWLNLIGSYDYAFSPDGKLYSCAKAYDSFMSVHGGYYYPGGLKYFAFDAQTEVEEHEAELPVQFPVLSNYPNPFNPATTISFTLPEAGYTGLVIYSISGQKVRTLVDSYQTAGDRSFVWDSRDDNGSAVSSGIYISQLKFGDSVVTGKMLIIK